MAQWSKAQYRRKRLQQESNSTTTAAEPEKLSITDRYRLWKESQLEAAAEIEVPTADDATTEATAN